MNDVKDDMAEEMNGLTGNMTAEVTSNTGSMMSGATTTNYNGGPININVYGAEGQSVDAIAEAVAYKLEALKSQKERVFA